MREALEACSITALKEQLETQCHVKIQAFTKERDSLKELLARAERNNVGKDSYV